jgi:hypothetical protein
MLEQAFTRFPPDYESGGREFESLRARQFCLLINDFKPATFLWFGTVYNGLQLNQA